MLLALEARLGGKHLLVQNAHDQHFPGVCHVKHDVLAVLESAQARVKKIATSTQRWVICQ
jgi:phosphoribosylpyrophosphate synthetase